MKFKSKKRSKRQATTSDDSFLDSQIKMILTNTRNFIPNLKNNYSGNTALTISIYKKDLNKIKLLLQNGEDINIIDSSGRSPLITAVRNGDDKAVKLLLKYKPNSEQYERDTGYTAIFYAVVEHHHKILHMLLEYGANPNIRYEDNYHTPPLISANDLKTLELLTTPKYNVDLYAADGEATTALGYAIIYNKIPFVKLLLKKGMDPNMKCFGGDNNDKSALVYCLENNQSEILKLLLAHDANLTGKFNKFENYDDTSSKIIEYKNYKTPFDICIKNSNENKGVKIIFILRYLRLACRMDFNNLENWLRSKNFSNKKDVENINKTLISLINECDRHKKLIENLDLFEKSKKSTASSFMKSAMNSIVDSDRVIPMNVFTFLDGKLIRKSKRN